MAFSSWVEVNARRTHGDVRVRDDLNIAYTVDK
jgi:hypothetical protein